MSGAPEFLLVIPDCYSLRVRRLSAPLSSELQVGHFKHLYTAVKGLVVPLSVAGGVLLWSIVNLQRLATCPPRIKVPSGMHG
ncbi:hypothetical protein Pcinc_005056 [Petrolisthes cinctipes]|nr:hypothetical protein Pcinc_005056 [Petrolisthes cinctipes]